MNLRYTKHALIRMKQRQIKEEMVEEIIAEAEVSLEQDDGCIRYYKFSGELGHYIRVVCKGDLVITVMPDRNFKGTRK